MVNIGRPSRGCTLCRQRRIKCDQRKPGCFKCEKFGRECPGYVKPDKWLFIDQSSQSGVGSSAQRPADPLRSCSRSNDNEDELFSTAPKPLNISTDLEFKSRCLFINTFVNQADPATGSPGHLAFLPQLFLDAADDSCLKHAVTASALAYMSNFETSPTIFPLMAKVYSSTIRALNKALAGPEATLDETLAAVHLMGLYEILTPNFLVGNWKSHVLGTIQLLRIRGKQQLKSPTGRQLYSFVVTPIIIGSLRSGETPPEAAIGLLREMNHPDEQGESFPTVAARFFFEVAMFRAEANQMLYFQGQPDPEHLLTFVDRGRMLHSLACEQLATSVAEDWQPIEEIDSKGEMMYTFRSRWIMSHWVKIWCAELCLYNVLAKIAGFKTTAQRVFDNWDESYMAPAYVSKAREAAGNIIRCIPYALCDFISTPKGKRAASPDEIRQVCGPLYIIFGLESVCRVEAPRPDQKMHAGRALRRIAAEFGIMRIHAKRASPQMPHAVTDKAAVQQ